VGVAQIVETDAAGTGLGDELIPDLREAVGLDRCAGLGVGEHEIALVACPVGHQLLELHAPPGPQCGDGTWVEVDRAPARRSLRRADFGVVAGGEQLLVDDEAGFVEVRLASRHAE
jgi:hypothetical protein